MTNRTVSSRASQLAVLLALAALLLGALPVHAASSVKIDAQALVGGRYEAGGWAAISVTLVNDGAPTEGYLESTSDGGTVRRFVELPAGARKVTPLYVRPEAFARRVTVRYVEPNGTVQAEVEVRVLNQSGGQVAIVGDPNGLLRPQLAGSNELRDQEPITLGVADLPERPEPLSGISALVWAADSTGLSEAQRRSIERWVAGGGQLVVIGGADWQARTDGLVELLPVEALTAEDAVPHAALAAWSGSADPAIANDTVSTGSLRDDARALVRTDDDQALISMRAVGTGRVILVGSDLATEAYRGWDGAPRLWDRLLDTGSTFSDFFGGMPPEAESQTALSQALANLPSLEVPPAELLLALIVAYIVLIGPISYVVLRRLDRRELAWITAPVLVVLFAGCSYGIGSVMKGGDVIVNEIALIRSSGSGTTASVESYAGIFSPERTAYELDVEADALVSQLQPAQFGNGQRRETDTLIEQGNPARVRNLSIGVFGFEGIRADALVDHQAVLSVSWRVEDGELIGTVTNNGEQVVEDVAYVSPSQGEKVGDLEPGESADFELSARNFNGSPASEQIYGFGGFEMSTPEQRETVMRRQVIDALVGYGGFMPGVEIDLALSGGRGPFVIGWIADAAPLTINVDQATAQRYSSTVEVVSVRPAVLSGEATISPLQMSISVVATDGDASPAGPGTINMTDGSATFSIALPLEATEMAVDEIEIIAAPDPMMALEQVGGGFWPAGYTLAVRDQATGEWLELGDLSRSNRFEVEDPVSVMSDTGRLEVRVTGVEVPANFGPTSVFVSAEVKGVIGE